MSFRTLILEDQEEHISDTTNKDIVDLLEHLNLNPEQLEDIAEDILESYVLFSDEFEYIQDGTTPIDEELDDIELKENEIIVDEIEYLDDELDEAFQKVSKGKRMQDRRKSRKNRRKAVVKKDLKKRGMKKCSGNQHVQKVSKGVFKCVARDSKSKKRGRRMKKYKRLYSQG